MANNDDQKARPTIRPEFIIESPQGSPRIVTPSKPNLEQKGLQASPRLQMAKPTAVGTPVQPGGSKPSAHK